MTQETASKDALICFDHLSFMFFIYQNYNLLTVNRQYVAMA